MAALSMMDPLGMLDMGAGSFGSLPSIMTGVSPSNSSADDYDFAEHDEDAPWEHSFTGALGGSSAHGGESQNAGSPDEGAEADDGSNKKRGGRRPASTAAKRATHNAVERARRESLNGRFDYLAKQLPMHDVKRASKNAIVEKAIEFVASATHRDRQLVADNASLLAELNELRTRLGMPARAATTIIPLPAPERRSKKTTAAIAAAAITPAVVPPTVKPAAAAPRDGRSISPRTVPASVPQARPASQVVTPTVAMPMSMAPTQPAPASAVIQAANSAFKAPTEASPVPVPMSSFMPAFDWQMAAAAQHYAGMTDPLAFNPFVLDAFHGFGTSQQQQQQQQQAAMNASAPQFWASYAMPFVAAS